MSSEYIDISFQSCKALFETLCVRKPVPETSTELYGGTEQNITLHINRCFLFQEGFSHYTSFNEKSYNFYLRKTFISEMFISLPLGNTSIRAMYTKGALTF
jgi:hypothetical protein